MLVFGLWAVITGVVLTARCWQARTHAASIFTTLAWFWTAVVGVLALIVPATDESMALVVGSWAVGFAVLLGIAWLRERAAQHASQSGLVSIMSLALGLALLLMPRNSVVSVGLLGAYFVMIAVWLVIGALSPRGSVEAEGVTE